MNPGLLAVFSAASILTGILAAILGFHPGSDTPTTPPRNPARNTRKPIPRKLLAQLGIAVGVGIAAALLTGWVILIPLLPLLTAFLPYLFGQEGGDDIEKLDALDEWSRSLAGVIGAGVSLGQAITVTQTTAPPALRPQINSLVARIRSRMPLEAALRHFAVEVNDATCDKIVCALILVSKRGDGGLGRVLSDLAESVAEEVAARRMVHAERAKQSATARYVTWIAFAAFAAFLLLGGSYIAPYSTPLGSILLLLLITSYIALLIWMRRMTRTKPLPRLLTQDRRPA